MGTVIKQSVQFLLGTFDINHLSGKNCLAQFASIDGDRVGAGDKHIGIAGVSSITILSIIPVLSRDTIFSEATNEFVVKFAATRTTKGVILALTIKDFVTNLEAVGAHGHVGEHKAHFTEQGDRVRAGLGSVPELLRPNYHF